MNRIRLKTTYVATVGLLTLLVISVWPLQVLADGEEISEVRQVSANERIRLEAMRGVIVIRAGTGNELIIEGTLDEEAEGFSLESGNGFTSFEVQMPRRIDRGSWRNNDNGSELKVQVPVGSDVEFTGINSRLEVSGIQGATQISTVNGDIDAKDLAGIVELSTVNGDINNENSSGRVSLSTVNGDINDENSSGRLALQVVNGRINTESSAEEVELVTVSGRVEAKLRSTRDIEVSTVSGNIEVILSDSPRPRVEGSTVSGNITLVLEEDISARFSLTTRAGGSIRNDITDDEPERSGFLSSHTLEFSSGEGEGNIELNTLSGTLRLELP